MGDDGRTDTVVDDSVADEVGPIVYVVNQREMGTRRKLVVLERSPERSIRYK